MKKWIARIELPLAIVFGIVISGISVSGSKSTNGFPWQIALTVSARAQDALPCLDILAKGDPNAGQLPGYCEAQNFGRVPNWDEMFGGWFGDYWFGSSTGLGLGLGGTGAAGVGSQAGGGTSRNRGGSGTTSVGDPINYATGNVYDSVVDYATAGPFPLVLARYYNSGDTDWRQFGRNWRSSYSRSVSLTDATKLHAAVTRDDGQVLLFNRTVKGCWYSLCQFNPWMPPAYSSYRLEGDVGDGNVVVTTEQGEGEVYDSGGKFLYSHEHGGEGVRTASAEYDESGRLSKVTDTYGRALRYFYNDGSSKISKVAAPDGKEYAYGYDGSGNLRSTTDPDGFSRKYYYEDGRHAGALTGVDDEKGVRLTTFSYDGDRRAVFTKHAGDADTYNVDYADLRSGKVKVTSPLGSQDEYKIWAVEGLAQDKGVRRSDSKEDTKEYDGRGNLTSYTDFNGNRTVIEPDAERHLPRRQTVASGTSVALTITTEWHPDFRRPTKIVDGERVFTFEYDELARLKSETVATSASTSTRRYERNGRGLVARAWDPLGNPTRYDRDAMGNLTKVTNALGQVTAFTSYDDNGRPLTIEDPNGVVTTLKYNFRGQVTSRIILGQETTYYYDPIGQLVKIREPSGAGLDFGYDAAHRLKAIRDRAGNRIVYTLDKAGNRTKEEVFEGDAPAPTRTHSRIYNILGRLAEDHGALSPTPSIFTYDDNGNIKGVKDPNRNETAFTYDEQNRLTVTKAPDAAESRSGYDANGRLASVTDPRGLVTRYTNNLLDLPEQITSPDTRITVKKYDAAGNEKTSTDSLGQTTSYDYDKLNRLTKATYADGSIATYIYDRGTYGVGRIASVTDSTGTTSFDYDGFGHVVQKTQTTGAVTLTTRWSYHPTNGRLIDSNYPSGYKLLYSYDGAGRVSAIALQRPDGARQALIGAISYAPFGPVKSWDPGATGSSYVRSFDLDGRIADITSSTGKKLTYTYDLGGRIKTISESNLAIKGFYYDTNDRLTRYVSGSTSILYHYDPTGNRTSAGDFTYATAPPSNRLNSITASSSGATQSFAHAATGIIVKQTGAFVLSYDARNRLVGTTVGALTASYGVNDLGQRVTKRRQTSGAGAYYAFLYDLSGHLQGTYDAGGEAIEEIVWLGDLPVATLQGGATYYIMPDHLGAPHQIVNSANAQVWFWDHDPFGNGAPISAAGFSHDLRFPGQIYDSETRLHNNGFRDYSPALGRYVESDPVGLEGGINTYAYAGNNPVNVIDPFGLDPEQKKSAYERFESALSPYIDIRRIRNDISDDPLGSLQGGLDGLGPVGAAGAGVVRITARVGTRVAPALGKGLAYLYQKVGAAGQHLKFGITNNPATRYTSEELAGGRLKILAQGPRREMLQLERNLHETLPIGPEEGQSFYVQKQIERGLNPPLYNP